MPNHSIEQEFRQLLREKTFSAIDDDGRFARFLQMLGDDRATEILKEEGIDLERYFSMAVDYFKGIKVLASAVASEQNKLDELLNPSQAHAVGDLLMAHLKLEYLVDRIITDNFKVNNGGNIIANSKLSFAQKLSMLPIEPGLSKEVVELLREINRLRNAYVHNIKFDIRNFKSKVFDESFKNENNQSVENRFKSIMKLIKGVEVILLLKTPSLKSQIDIVMKDNPVLKEVAFGLAEGKSKTIHDILLAL